ncbi:MAG: hypothetical protein A2W99_01120 [Bacteroidetes bacterium GWF2_33_16]|nr:MAG: hypothetical protein A2X00_03825 [Bacteroidetes bacterium GWE2_32_14]OFY08861.1 MAG: hypothetical protein A2W99_01120 [Bacteroidetes bacterium GWF2_33_16]
MYKQYLSYLILFTLITSCVEDFDVELNSTYERIIIQGSISNERKAHKVILSKSADYFSNEQTPRISGATVTISDGSDTFILTEVAPGIYETDTLAGVSGKTYTLNALIEGELYESSCYMNYIAPIDSIKIGYYDYGDFQEEDTFAVVLLYAQEPEIKGNYYLWDVYKNGVLESDTLRDKWLETDQFVNGMYISEYQAQWLAANTGDTVTLEMQSITEEYYEYYYQIMSVTEWNGGPLSGPPANPVGNISNDALGFFLAYSQERKTIIVPKVEDRLLLSWY